MKKLPLFLLILPGLALAGARVSAMKEDSKLGKSFYSGSAAIDGKLDTVWMVPGESENRGEWIEFEIPKGDVDKISIYPGHGKTQELFVDHARVKQVRVDIFALDDDQNATSVGSQTVDVADKPELQTIDLNDVKVGTGLFGGKVRITVVDIYEGEDMPNLAVAEVMVLLKEFDCPKPPDLSEVSGEMDGHAVAAMQDNDPKTFWAADASGAQFTMTSEAFGLSSVGFVGMGKDWARPKVVEITVGSLTRRTELPDLPGPQWAQIPAFNGYNGGGFGSVQVKILEVYPGTNPQVGVAELKVNASNYSAI